MFTFTYTSIDEAMSKTTDPILQYAIRKIINFGRIASPTKRDLQEFDLCMIYASPHVEDIHFIDSIDINNVFNPYKC